MKTALYLIGVVSALVLTVVVCSGSMSPDLPEKSMDDPAVKPLLAPLEYERQRNEAESVNRCVGLLEAAAAFDDISVIAAELKTFGITKVTSNEIQPLLSKAIETEQMSGLPDDELNEIIAKSQIPIISAQQLRNRAKEIAECLEWSRLEAQNR